MQCCCCAYLRHIFPAPSHEQFFTQLIAGLLTLPFWSFARLVLHHRLQQWQQLSRNLSRGEQPLESAIDKLLGQPLPATGRATSQRVAMRKFFGTHMGIPTPPHLAKSECGDVLPVPVFETFLGLVGIGNVACVLHIPVEAHS